MHEAPVVDHDANVVLLSSCFEENQVAGFEIASRNPVTLLFLIECASRNLDARLVVAVLHKPAAIKTTAGTVAAVAIGFADLRERLEYNSLALPFEVGCAAARTTPCQRDRGNQGNDQAEKPEMPGNCFLQISACLLTA